MKIPVLAILTAAVLLALPVVGAAAADDPFAGKTIEEIRRLIEQRMEGRKEDREFISGYKSFVSREEKKISRRGISIANSIRAKLGEYSQAEILFRTGQYTKCLEVLMQHEKRISKNRRARWTLMMVYRLMGAAYAWLGRPADATIYLGKARASGDTGNTYNKVAALARDFPTRRRLLKDITDKRDLAPRNGDLQWAVCEFYQTKIFLPHEEVVETAWMIKSFPDHPKVTSGDADWALINAHARLSDWSAVSSMCHGFMRKFGAHAAAKQGDVLWLQAVACFGLLKFKDAKRIAEQMRTQFPKHRKVESRTLDTFITECDTASSRKGLPDDGGNRWTQWWDEL